MGIDLGRNGKVKPSIVLKTILASIIMGLIWVSCTSDLPDIPDNKGESLEDGEQVSDQISCFFMSFNLSSPGNLSSRSETDNNNSQEDSSWQLQEGSSDENHINLIRLFFFRGNNPINVLVDETTSGFSPFYDWKMDTQSESMSPKNPEGSRALSSRAQNVEKILTTTFSIQFEGSEMPDKLVAIVNPSDYLKSLSFSSLDQLKEETDNYLTGLTSNNFLMTNSVYISADETSRKIIDATEIKKENICKSPEEALSHPISIYVERVVARLDINFGGLSEANVQLKPVEGMDYTYDTGISFSPVGNENPQKIYVKFLGWGITSSPTTSRLIKRLEPFWSNQEFIIIGDEWNQPNNFRALWAINPESPEYTWLSYNSILPSQDGNSGFPMNIKKAYIQENANPLILSSGKVKAATPSNPTKVIFAAQLINEKGDPLTVTEYQGRQYTFTGLQNVISNSLDMYFEEEVNGKTELKKILPGEITFKSSRDHGNEYGSDTNGSYFSYACLTESAAKKIWYHKHDDPKDKEGSRIPDPAKYIDDTVYEAQIWNEGRTYYYFDIRHFDGTPEDPGYFGVVRNHIYDARILSVKSLGTPVYSPDEIIYPETPAKTGNMLLVSINKIEWRLVKQHFQVSW